MHNLSIRVKESNAYKVLNSKFIKQHLTLKKLAVKLHKKAIKIVFKKRVTGLIVVFLVAYSTFWFTAVFYPILFYSVLVHHFIIMAKDIFLVFGER